ncbi:MAG: hypothetical protein JW841_09910 [Deltaproteobacteria bacterium]|nr:hypothetical protein [Deltaproteobacteria bacterium]
MTVRIPLKYLATLNDEALGEDTDADFEIQYIDIGNVDASGQIHEVVTYRFTDAPSRARRRVKDGDVIISCVRTYLQAIAPIENPTDNLIVSTGFAVVRPRPGVLQAGFCKYALRESNFLAEVECRSVGVSYPAINTHDLGDIPLPVPSYTIQCLVEKFLDREITQIDSLITAKQRLLDLLAEKRKALIALAVTRGIDPKAKLRDSGVPWLGEIPGHWIITRMKFIARIQTGIALGKNFGQQALIEFPYLRVANVQDGFIDLSDVKTMLVPIHDASTAMLRKGDVLMNEGGDADKLGRGAVWDGSIDPCLHQNHVFAIRPTNVSSKWLATWTESSFAKAYFLTMAKQSTNLASISATNIMELPVFLPPLTEQRAIVSHITRETAKLDKARVATERTIALLKERRAALISAAVTGQIDVGAAA